VSEEEVNQFAWDVRQAMNEFVRFARDQGLTKRAQVRAALDADERRSSLVETLKRDDPKLWGRYI
jgi:hypothetical protein